MKTRSLLKSLLAVLLLALLPQAAAAYDFVVDGLCYNRNSDGRSVTVTYDEPTFPGYLYSNLAGDLVIPESVTYSGITYSVTSIGICAFQHCSSLISVTIPNTVTSIGDFAFDNSSLVMVTIPNSVTSIDSHAFSWSSLGEVIIPNSVTSISESTFLGCMGLSSVAIPNSVTSIGDYAFGDCSGLTSVTIPNSVTSIGTGAFESCSSLTGELVIPNSVTSVGDYAFNWCTGLTSVTIPNSVTYIGDGAFQCCSSLTDIDSYIVNPSNVAMGTSVFTEVPTSTCILHVPAGTSDAYRNASQWKDFTTIVEMEPAMVLATSIVLDETTATLTEGMTLQLTATVSPGNTTNKTVAWSSSNPAVASVDEAGLVTAKAYGTATITAATTDGSNLSATCMVKVRGVSDLYGDINGDGVVDIADVNILINLMKGKEDPRATAETADVTGDGVADIADVNAVINAMLGKASPEVETFTVGGVSFKMVKVEGGTFTMGATAEQGSDAGDRESPAHQVTLSSYSIGQTEVTQELWQAVMGSNPSSFTGNLQRPVEQVSWSDCQTFITKLNQMTGKNFRLPTEAEWEYAARGGNQSRGYKYSGSNTIDDVAWYDGNDGSTAQPVATKAPNELGLYDMSGNVYEWCQDWYGSYSSDAQTDPTGPATGSNRVGRGGCWGSGAKYCRVSYRSHSAPSLTGDRLGLRLALCQIPDGFSQVEYIDVTGGQWIDTGIHADSSIEVQFTTMVAGRMADNTRFFSTHDPHPDYPEYQYPETSKLYDGWNALGTWGLSAEPNDLVIKPLGYNNLVETNCKISDFYNQKITLVLTGTGRFSLVKDNQTLNSYDAGSLTNTSTTSNTDIRLFTRVVYDAHELFKGKVYEVTITKSNQVVMHLLPYWDNNQDVGAFYDTVSKKFFYSNSSKSF